VPRACRFYQHLPTGCEWDWGLVWGHAVSHDLVHWRHLPPALCPSPGKLDADGCFSGCCTVDVDGVPTIMYTGVRLRSNPDCGPLPPTECDLQLPFIESQLIARAINPGARPAVSVLKAMQL
jgi:beta-fructofuranosidase